MSGLAVFFIPEAGNNIIIKFISPDSGGKPYFGCLIVKEKLTGHLNGEKMMDETKQPGDPADFDKIYLLHYPALSRYANTIVKDDVIAEDMVHNVFLKLMENEESLIRSANLKAYLYRSIYNECMNHIKHQQVETMYQKEKVNHSDDHLEGPAGNLGHKELKQAIAAALMLLPEQCRTVFQLSRYEELKYKEIAVTLNISVNTVEKHMVKALKRLRIQLEDYLPLLFLLFLTK